jgi:hypothetical protein
VRAPICARLRGVRRGETAAACGLWVHGTDSLAAQGAALRARIRLRWGVRARCRVRLRPLALLRPPCVRPTLARGGALLNLLLLLRERCTGLRLFLMLALLRTSLLLLDLLLLLLLRDRGAGLRALFLLTLLRTFLLLLGLRLLSRRFVSGRRPRMALRAFDLFFLDSALGGRSAMTRRGGAMWNQMRRGGARGFTLRCAMLRGVCSRLSAAPASAFKVCCL